MYVTPLVVPKVDLDFHVNVVDFPKDDLLLEHVCHQNEHFETPECSLWYLEPGAQRKRTKPLVLLPDTII